MNIKNKQKRKEVKKNEKKPTEAEKTKK